MSKKEDLLTHDKLLEYLRYDADTGKFFWEKVPSNRVKIGAEAGTVNNWGHRLIRLGTYFYVANRLAWFYVHKRWPLHEIDHINLRPDDNRLVNLREADSSQNKMNRRVRKDSTTGLKGVLRHSKTRYQGRIRVRGKIIGLGQYDTPEEAHNAYVEAYRKYHGEFGRID